MSNFPAIRRPSRVVSSMTSCLVLLTAMSVVDVAGAAPPTRAAEPAPAQPAAAEAAPPPAAEAAPAEAAAPAPARPIAAEGNPAGLRAPFDPNAPVVYPANTTAPPEPQPYVPPPMVDTRYVDPNPYAAAERQERLEAELRRDKEIGVGMAAGGFSVFGASYLITALAGAITIDNGNADRDDREVQLGQALMIPVAGPFIGASRTRSATGAFGSALVGVIQVSTLTVGIIGSVKIARSNRQLRMSLKPGYAGGAGFELKF